MQVYYELDEERKNANSNDIAICRVEQICPFPYDLIQQELNRYPSMFLRNYYFSRDIHILILKSNDES